MTNIMMTYIILTFTILTETNSKDTTVNAKLSQLYKKEIRITENQQNTKAGFALDWHSSGGLRSSLLYIVLY